MNTNSSSLPVPCGPSSSAQIDTRIDTCTGIRTNVHVGFSTRIRDSHSPDVRQCRRTPVHFRTHAKMLLGLRAFTIFLLLLLCLSGHAQENSGPFVTLSEKEAPLDKLFKKIQAQTGFHFLYENKILENTKKVTLEVKHEPLHKVLALLFDGQPLNYKIIDKTIVINELTAPSNQNITPTHLTGLVLNAETNAPIAAASVHVKGTTRTGTITNASGNFSLPVIVGEQLTISCIGFEKKDILILSQEPVKVQLKPASTALNEVVVTNGYQDLDQRTLTSAITTLKAKDILVPGMLTIDQALEGRVPGLFIINNSGEVGSSPKIRVRGTSTILGNQEPVWVVDGIVVNPPLNIDPQTVNDLDFVNRLGNAISGLNPQDIDQINVLKDASATALYGVKAANGVIVITTKKGHPGPPVFSYNVSGTYTRRPRYTDDNINVMNSRERVDYSREIVDKGLDYPSTINWVGYEGALHNLYLGNINYAQFQQQVSTLETMNTDWFKALTQDAISDQHTLTISGGGSNIRYYASLGVSEAPGTLIGDKVERYTSTVNLNADLNPRLQWSFGLLGNIDKRNYAAASTNALSYAYNTSRDISAYSADGSLSYYKKGAYSNNQYNFFDFNALNEIRNARDVQNGNSIRLTNTLNYKVTGNLRASATFSYTNAYTAEQVTYNANTFYAASLRGTDYNTGPPPSSSLLPVGGELQTNTTRNTSWDLRGQMDYVKAFGRNNQHLIGATLGGEASSNQYYGYNTDRRGYLPDRGETFAPVDPAQFPQYAQWDLLNNVDKITDQLNNLASGYFTASYTYNNLYTLNFNTRTDFSNKFGSSSNDKFLPVWSLSGRWDIGHDLLTNVKAVDLLAFRASYGYQGNMLDYQTPNLIIKQGATDPITGENTSTIAYYPNPNLRWEKTGQWNGGLDFSFFHNKLQGSLNYFYKKTTNAFLTKEVSDVNGVDNYVVNAGTLENRGVDVTLNFMPINNSGAHGGKGFKWRLDPQLGQVINRLIARALVVSNAQDQASGNPNFYSSYLDGSALINNKPINSFWSYQFNGLSHTDGRPTFKYDDTSYQSVYAKMTPDQVFQTVMRPSGNRIATLQGGINNYFSYGNFTLTMNLTYSIGSKIRLLQLYPNATDGNGTAAAPPEQNLSKELLNRWEKPGDEQHTNIPGLLYDWDYIETIQHWSTYTTIPYADNIWQMYDNSDIRVVSGDYLKISSVNFSYKLPAPLLKKWSMKDCYLSLAGMNLYTFASKQLHGQDPTQSGFSSIQLSVRPSYSFNINVSF